MIATHLLPALRAAFLGSSRAAAPRAGVIPGSLRRPEGERHYLLGVPGRPCANRRPLVVILHGAGASAKQVLGMAFPPSPLSVWLEIAEREQVLVAAAEIPHKLAAFSALLACMPPPGRVAPPKAPLPDLIVAATKDPFMPYEGGKFFHTLGFLEPMRSIDDSVKVWRELAGLPDTPAVTVLTSGGAASTTTATRYLWGEADGLQVGLYRIEGGGHAEPSRLQRYPGIVNRLAGPQNADVETAEAAWDFFKDKRRARPSS